MYFVDPDSALTYWQCMGTFGDCFFISQHMSNCQIMAIFNPDFMHHLETLSIIYGSVLAIINSRQLILFLFKLLIIYYSSLTNILLSFYYILVSRILRVVYLRVVNSWTKQVNTLILKIMSRNCWFTAILFLVYCLYLKS